MPDEEMKEAQGAERRGKIGPGVRVLILLVIFGCLGALVFLGVVGLFRGMFDGGALYLILRLGFFLLAAWLTIYGFRKYKAVRLSTGGDLPIQIGLVLLAWGAFFLGAGTWRFFYESPGGRLSDQIDSDRQACSEHAKTILAVSGVTDSHEPGSGYIVVKARFAARKPVVVSGGNWVTTSDAGVQFYSEMERTELRPGQPREITFHVLVNPEHDNSPKIFVDGPYSFKEIWATVYDPSVTEHWAPWAGEISCTAPVIKNFTTRPYKAEQFGRVKWTGKDDSSFKPRAF